MSLVAFRRDTEDPEIVKRFAGLVGIEERLKMLCLLTLADVDAVSPETLTPWREELLWRLYVDTYNHLTLQYGDDVIDRRSGRARRSCWPGGPPDITEAEITGSSKACRAATCSSSRARRSTATSSCRATSRPITCTPRSSPRATPGS